MRTGAVQPGDGLGETHQTTWKGTETEYSGEFMVASQEAMVRSWNVGCSS